jgi:glycosyltransferase involved in cell wall biosynthesis
MNRATRHCPNRPGIPIIARLGGYYDLKYYRKAAYLIGNTPDLVTYFHGQGWPAANTTWLPNFPETPPPGYQPISNPDAATIRLLALGRLHANKGFDALLQAMALLPATFHLTLAGEGPEKTPLHQLAQELGLASRLTWLPWQEEPHHLFAHTDLFICPSRHEPLGNVILEAMAHQVPIIATATDGARHLLQHEESGLLTPVDDAPALAAAIQQLAESPSLARTCLDNAYQTYLANYSEAAVVRRYIQFFESISLP